jgi:kynurenine 3-monooxygenase
MATGESVDLVNKKDVKFDITIAARSDKDTRELAELHIMGPVRDIHAKPLQGLRVIVVGAGPSGLIFAKDASANGAAVTVFEKFGDPRTTGKQYTNRSFNISVDRVGRYVLGDTAALQGGIRVVGRAVHQDSEVIHTEYGTTPDSDLINIPRPLLRQNMVELALREGADIHFDSKVIDVDIDKGQVAYEDATTGTHWTLRADLVVICDGLHSIADQLITEETGELFYARPELRRIVSAMIYPKFNKDLSIHHIHFWHEPVSSSFVVGIPNRDTSIALLMASPYGYVDSSTHPFATLELARMRYKQDFPQLHTRFPSLAEQLPGQQVYHFKYKAHSTFRIGDKGVVVGDAGCVMPPWANYGANSSMANASSLVYHLIKKNGNIDQALNAYQAEQRILSRLLLDYAGDQGEFFNGAVIKNPKARSDQALAQLIRQANQEAATQPRVLPKAKLSSTGTLG